MATEYIDMTPTWQDSVPTLITIFERGTFEARRKAADELWRMAELADKYVELKKAIDPVT